MIDQFCYTCGKRIVEGRQLCSCELLYKPTPENRGAQVWRTLHRYPFTVETWDSAEAARWYDKWLERIPHICNCPRDWRRRTRKFKPDFRTREMNFVWGFERHNELNQILKKPVLSFEEALAAHGFVDAPPRTFQPLISDYVAVTAISPLPKHLEVQPRCLDSWKAAGLTIVAVATSKELETVKRAYPQVDLWLVNEYVSTDYNFPTQRINNLLDVALKLDKPILLINSDIEIRGPMTRLNQILASGKVGVGIRYNYTNYWRNAKREGWGIDAFLMTPPQARTVSRFPFAIGRPMWDYWLPYHFDQIGQPMEWIGEPFFFHAAHPVHWSKSDLEMGRNWLHSYYGRVESWEDVRRTWPFCGP